MSRMIVVTAILGSFACGGAGSRRADLVGDLRNYGDGVRWNDFARASLNLRPENRPAFMDSREQVAEDLRISDWEMKRLTYSEGRNKAVVQVEWKWHLDSRGIVHTTVTEQKWTRHGKRWILDQEHRVKGDPMPGVAEPAETDTREAERSAQAAP